MAMLVIVGYSLGLMSATPTTERPSWVSTLRTPHPIAWMLIALMLIAVVAHLFTDTGYLIGNLDWFWWTAMLVGLAMSLWHDGLNRLRLAIEVIPKITVKLAMILAWAVFLLQFFNVITRYGNEYVERDILYGEVVSLAWQSFGLMFLVAVNAGVRNGVNPRIDFWWANFRNKTKAGLDFAMHTMLLLPFIAMSVSVLQTYTASALGQRYNGEWPAGWRVWNSWEQAVDAGGLAVGPIKAMMLVGFVLFGLQVLAEVIKTGFVLIGRDDYGDIVESDAPLRIE
ncbi:MAG: TRAP transporter small permease subunit [Acidimicrobiaceae bacterium]|nr:TRAP transporter small permease subunit [Acidimicrobiaceae bacterium]